MAAWVPLARLASHICDVPLGFFCQNHFIAMVCDCVECRCYCHVRKTVRPWKLSTCKFPIVARQHSSNRETAAGQFLRGQCPMTWSRHQGRRAGNEKRPRLCGRGRWGSCGLVFVPDGAWMLGFALVHPNRRGLTNRSGISTPEADKAKAR